MHFSTSSYIQVKIMNFKFAYGPKNKKEWNKVEIDEVNMKL